MLRPRHYCQLVALLLFGLLLAINIDVLWNARSPWLPATSGQSEQNVGDHVWRQTREPSSQVEVEDDHPIRQLMHNADHASEQYNNDRSKTFRQTVQKYRLKYGRHPPPGFDAWYRFARERQVHNVDDFQQINDDLRPFWAVRPQEIRHSAAHASDELGDLVATISLRQGSVFQEEWGWRSETFTKMIGTVAHLLPDMDIPVNRMDQPRVVVSWDELQAMLKVEEETRSLSEDRVLNRFTKRMSGMYTPHPQYPAPVWLNRYNPFLFPKQRVPTEDDPRPDYGWINYAGGKFMELVADACPPSSHARIQSNATKAEAEKSYKHDLGGFVTNFNASSDLCTVGPQIAGLHGMMYASTSMLVVRRLLPIFGECKTNINNDILFPANMYWKKDKRYSYKDTQDINWDDKDDLMIWRGVTSGGNTVEGDPERWHNMHRQRLVLMTNSTELNDSTISIVAKAEPHAKQYSLATFRPAQFAAEHTDIGFTEKIACIPNCDFYNSSLTMLSKTSFSQTFGSKYLIDVDGHSFSGRWRAFLQSRSLGLKATIFREWHDSRLFAWRHFVPVDNRYDDLYSLLLYFIGYHRDGLTVQRHDYEAMKMAKQAREWAAQVLRREDMEVYLLRLLLEYGRVIDDNRDHIGYVGDGGKEMEAFDRRVPAMP